MSALTVIGLVVYTVAAIIGGAYLAALIVRWTQ
jgi:hypothetical protein